MILMHQLTLLKKIDRSAKVNKKLIEEKIQVFERKLEHSIPIKADELEEIKGLRKKLKKIALDNHSDRNNPDRDEDLLKKTLTLMGLLNDCLSIEGSAQSQELNKNTDTTLQEDANGYAIMKSDVKYLKKSPHKDFEYTSLIEFYQKWVAGADKYYFSHERAHKNVIKTIYGKKSHYLNKFFHKLHQISFDNPGHETFITEKNRIQLFSTLSKIKQPQLYLIPLKRLSKVINLLVSRSNQNDFANYLDCMVYFFELKIFSQLIPKTTSPEDLEKIGLLFEVVMNIATTKFVSKENPKGNTFNLINNLCNVIKEHFWDDFDAYFAKNISRMFGYSENTGELLTADIFSGDLHEFINLIKNTAYPEKLAIRFLGKYLDSHFEIITNQLSGIVRPAFQIALANTSLIDFLPQPYFMTNMPVNLQQGLWNFLSNRRNFTQKDLTRFINLINGSYDPNTFEKNILNPLINLPPNVSLSYINEQLTGLISKTNQKDASSRLKSLKNAAKVFNTFAYNFGLIDATNDFSQPRNSQIESYKLFVRVFNNLTTAENELLFTMFGKEQYHAIPLNILEAIAEKFKSSDVRQLSRFMNLASNIDKISSIQCKDQLYLEYRISLLKEDRVGVYKLEEFVETLKDSKLPKNIMIFLWAAWAGGKSITDKNKLKVYVEMLTKAHENGLEDTNLCLEWNRNQNQSLDNLQNSLEIHEHIRKVVKKYPRKSEKIKKDFEDTYNRDKEYIAHLEIFLATINSSAIDEMYLPKLWEAWKLKKIKDEHHLQQTIANITIAKQLATSENWGHYFSDFNTNQKERIAILQLIRHGIITKNVEFVDSCYKNYQNLLNRFIKIPNLNEVKNLEERRFALISGYRRVVSVAEEISTICNFISERNAEPQPAPLSNRSANKYHQFFSECQSAYDKTWGKNSTRKQQASTLFHSLREKARDININTNFYSESMKEIWRSQQEILQSDKNTKRNSKGYSRLYDITVEMMINLATNYLSFSNINHLDKAWLRSFMQEQMQYQIQLLAERLPANNCYTELFSTFARNPVRNSSEYKTFETEISKVTRDKIPKHLHYLLTNVKCFVNLATITRDESDQREAKFGL